MTRNLFLCAAAVLLAGGVSVSADEPKKPADDKSGGKRADDKKTFDDAEFVAKAASGGMHEVEMGKLAAKQAKNDAVKQFGQKLVDDHTKANEELKKAAKAAGLTVPEKMTAEHQKMVDQFKDMKGEDFDKAFAKHAVEDHEKDIKEFTRASKEAKNPQIKEFATKTLPTLQGHLDAAKKLSGGK